jgi:hypothetical protein
VQRRLLITAVLSGLSRSLQSLSSRLTSGAALRSTLGGSDIEILDRDRQGERWSPRTGTPRRCGRSTTARPRSPPIVLDEGLSADGELVEAIVSLAEAAVREARLKAELATSLSDLDESRKRIATAADVERRRIERDLHDGAQQRLIALRMRLSLAEDLLRDDPAAASEAVRGLGEDIDHTLEELRSLAHGIYPALLADRGLADALGSIARRSPLRTEVWAAGSPPAAGRARDGGLLHLPGGAAERGQARPGGDARADLTGSGQAARSRSRSPMTARASSRPASARARGCATCATASSPSAGTVEIPVVARRGHRGPWRRAADPARRLNAGAVRVPPAV